MSRPTVFGRVRAKLKGEPAPAPKRTAPVRFVWPDEPEPSGAPIASRRATTSSRTGSTVHRGTVRVVARPLVRCDDCGALWVGGGIHSLRVLAGGARVDCQGAHRGCSCAACLAAVPHE